MLLLALILAAVLRFAGLDQVPSGLYRDEAFNGLDAAAVLTGDHALFFEANNGREPAYIYLTAGAVALFGQTTFAVRFAAALVGTLTVIPVWLLARRWFGSRPSLLAAFLWAITLWPMHLSRIGLRAILLPPLLALTFWLGTLAWQKGRSWLWLLAGAVFGLAFYTYLAVRIVPLLLVVVGLVMLLRGDRRRLWPGVAWFVAGSAVVLLPFALLIWQQPELFLGRTGQVSILHPDVSGGNPLGTLLSQTTAALGMTIWRGDTILRHNPAGRPVFDWLMALPFVIGTLWCLRHWRRPPALVTLLWVAVMLLPTILAADAPHFLRAVGVLPALLFLPALGLDWLWTFPRRSAWLPSWTGGALVVALMVGSLALTVRDYIAYGRDPDVALAFELGARELAEQISAESDDVALFADQRFWSDWPSVAFLVDEPERLGRDIFWQNPPHDQAPPTVLYAWPYEPLDFVPTVVNDAAVVSAEEGALVRNDLQPEAFPLFVRFAWQPATDATPLAQVGDGLALLAASAELQTPSQLEVEVVWQTTSAEMTPTSMFVHVLGPNGLIGQHDGPPGGVRWPLAWWSPSQPVAQTMTLSLSEPFDPAQHRVVVGLVDPISAERLPVVDAAGDVVGESWPIEVE